MRTPTLSLASLALAAALAPTCQPPRSHSWFGQAEHVHGDYVEARTASVFAGPCHFNGEYTTQGRTALLAWSIAGGTVDGVALGGVSVAAVVTADGNLDTDAARRSVVYVDDDADEVRAAVRAWLEREHAGALGEVLEVRPADVSVDVEDERFAVAVGDVALLRGEVVPDRACCTMPSNVWYEPLVAVNERVAGYTEVFDYRDPTLGPVFRRGDENSAFLATF